MTNETTIEKMQQMRLHGMRSAFQTTMQTGFTHQFTPDELIAHLVDAEWEERHNRKLARLLTRANFRYKATVEHIDFSQPRDIDKNLILRLARCEWIKQAENVLITGPTGIGKSFLACAFGHQAAIDGYSVLYFNAVKLFATLKFAKADGTYTKELKKIQKQDLIVLDDFALHPIDEQSKLILLELLEDRYNEKSTLIASQLPITKWHEVIDNPTIADAICDRLIHNAHRIEVKGVDSMRKTMKSVQNNTGRKTRSG